MADFTCRHGELLHISCALCHLEKAEARIAELEGSERAIPGLRARAMKAEARVTELEEKGASVLLESLTRLTQAEKTCADCGTAFDPEKEGSVVYLCGAHTPA